MTKAEATKLAKEWNAKYKAGQMLTIGDSTKTYYGQSGAAYARNLLGWDAMVPVERNSNHVISVSVSSCKPIYLKASSTPEPPPKQHASAATVRDLIISDLNCYVTSIGYGIPQQDDTMIAAYFHGLEALILLRKAIYEREGK